MSVHKERRRPEPWSLRCRNRPRWLVALYALDLTFDWIAHLLSRWAFLEVLEYLGTFSVLIAVVFYFGESGDRIKQKHYQAWQVINTAQGKGGSGGRIEALQELNADHVPLVGIDLSDSFLFGIRLDKAQLARSVFSSSDLRECAFSGADLSHASFNTANLRSGDLRRANLSYADFQNADLTGANLAEANAAGANFANADLRNAVLRGLKWREIVSIKGANLFGARDLPPGFKEWALRHGALFSASFPT